MRVSPANLIEGLILICKANAAHVNRIVRKFDKDASLHLFKGIRKTLPQSQFPSLEFDVDSGGLGWVTTSAQSCDYAIQGVLTVRCGSNPETAVDYISELSRMVTWMFNEPRNMGWRIPNEFFDEEKKVPVLCQYSRIDGIQYSSTKDYSMRVATFDVNCRTTEMFRQPVVDWGPSRV